MVLDAAEEISCPVDSSHCSVFIKGGLDVLHCIIHACSFDAKIVNTQKQWCHKPGMCWLC